MVYRYRPTLFETAVDDSDSETRGWNLIDHPTWARLKELLDLPDTCRLELVNVVRGERTSHHRRKNQPQPKPSESREELLRLVSLAGKLSKGLREMDGGARSAVLMSLKEKADFDWGEGKSPDHRAFRNPFGFYDSKPIERLISDFDHIEQRLARAREIALPWVGRVGGDPGLRDFIRRLDSFLLRYVGQGLVRTRRGSTNPRSPLRYVGQEPVRTRRPKRGGSKPRGGIACLEFVELVARVAYGKGAFTANAIDDAVKDVINCRRKDVGRIPQKKGQSPP
jgi:hypothetical protein